MVKILFVIIMLLGPNQSRAIYNGTPAKGTEFLNVHKILFKYTEGGRTRDSSFCTATVVADHTLLTAGHCARRFMGLPGLKILIRGTSLHGVESIHIPAGYDAKRNNWKYHLNTFIRYQRSHDENNASQVQRMEYLKDKSQQAFRELASGDIAVIRTKTSIPKWVWRTKLNFNKQNIGDQVYAVGYGHTYWSRNFRRYMYPPVPYYRIEKIKSVSPVCHELWSRHTSDRVTTAGDSGSPLVLKNTNEQIGILSGQIEYKFAYASAFAKLEHHRLFIQQFLK